MIFKTFLVQICAALRLFHALIARAEGELATGFKWKGLPFPREITFHFSLSQILDMVFPVIWDEIPTKILSGQLQ